MICDWNGHVAGGAAQRAAAGANTRFCRSLSESMPSNI